MKDKKPPILVVDDEPEMCWILENISRKAGFTCMKALNAKEALALTKDHRFIMAFLDAKLPDTDGLDLARKLRKTYANLFIVIISGYFYKDELVIDEGMKEGIINAFIAKPFDHEEIVRIIQKAHVRKAPVKKQGKSPPRPQRAVNTT
ncbi:MAG: response regulator [Deltaproteobacteria bacterium]|nr:response regulator [Deltaproteobacteria bacterium]